MEVSRGRENKHIVCAGMSSVIGHLITIELSCVLQQSKSHQLAQNETVVDVNNERVDELDGASLLMRAMEEKVGEQCTLEASKEGNSKSKHTCLHNSTVLLCSY